MINKVKYGQLALLICITLPAGKLLSLPYLCFRQTGKDFWLGMALAVVVELLAVLAVLWGMKINENNLSLKEVLQNTIGKFMTSAILILLAGSFFMRFIYVLSDIMVLYGDIFVLKSDWTIFALIALASVWFVLTRGFRTVARLAEILFIPVMVCLIAISVLSLSDCKFDKLLPLAEEGATKVLESFLFVGVSFGDAMILAVLSGDLQPARKGGRLVLLGTAIGAISTVVVCVIYLALFGELAFLGDVAIARISQFNFNTSVTGRLDWLFISGWVIAVFLLLYLYVYCFLKCWGMATTKTTSQFDGNDSLRSGFFLGRGYGLITYIVFALVVMILPLFVDVHSVILTFFMKGIGRYIDLAIRLGIAFLYPFAVMVTQRKTHNSEQSYSTDISVELMEI